MARVATLLIVEDEPETAGLLGSYFQAQGYEVLTAASGEEALALARERLPDLVVLDIRLPDIDGFEVFRQLRAHRRTREIPVIFLTEKREREDRWPVWSWEPTITSPSRSACRSCGPGSRTSCADPRWSLPSTA